ncbi:hypothetical protein pb186bvf_019440 [Paramecium bursaria]
MKSIIRSLGLISKNDIEIAIENVTEDTQEVPKAKHYQTLLTCLKGEDIKILPLDAFTRIFDAISTVQLGKWNKSLKIAHLLQRLLEVKIYKKAQKRVEHLLRRYARMNYFDRVKKPIKKSEDACSQLHQQLSQNLYFYLRIRYENHLFLQNALSDFPQKEIQQQIFIIHRIVQIIQFLLKMQRELDFSLEKFQVPIIKSIAFELIQDLNCFYPIIYHFLNNQIVLYRKMDYSAGQKLYHVYTETLKMNRGVQQLLRIHKQLSQTVEIRVTLFQVDLATNKEIELYFKDFSKYKHEPDVESFRIKTEQPTKRQEQMQEALKLNFGNLGKDDKIELVRFDDDSLQEIDHGSPQVQLLQQFQSEVVQKPIIQFEPQPEKIVYNKQASIQTERSKIQGNKWMEQSHHSQQSIISTSDNSVRTKPLSRQSSMKSEFFNPTQSPLHFLNFGEKE